MFLKTHSHTKTSAQGDSQNDTTPPKLSTGHHYKGNLPYAYWVGAKDIEIGHRLIDDKGNYQTVIAIHTKSTPLDSYNLEVDTDHTFFIKGIDGVDAVCVHNKDCWADIPSNARQTQIGNDTVYEFDDNGRTVQVIKNPEWKQGDKKAQYIEVETTNGQVSVKHKDRTDLNYSYGKNGNKVVKDENNQYFVNDPNDPKVDAGYHRPYLRADTIREIESRYIKLTNGDYQLKGTKIIIKAPVDIGYVAGFEHRRLEIVAEELKMTQAELNEYVNARSHKFQLENRSVNRSHIDEMSGKDIPSELKEDRTKFLNQLRGVKK